MSLISPGDKTIGTEEMDASSLRGSTKATSACSGREPWMGTASKKPLCEQGTGKEQVFKVTYDAQLLSYFFFRFVINYRS